MGNNWDSRLNYLRGKGSVGGLSVADMREIFEYIDILTNKMDSLDYEDFFGSEGWRHFFGVD